MTKSRSGTALILALLLLASLLLLGLPFLYSQSTSVAGTRSFAAQHLAKLGCDNVHSLATAMAAYAVQPSWIARDRTAIAGWQQWSSLAVDLDSTQVSLPWSTQVQRLERNILLSDGSIGILPHTIDTISESSPVGQPPPPFTTYVGAVVTDESGKLDPNHMTAEIWERVLAAVGIPDWNDQLVYADPGVPPAAGYPPGTYLPSHDTLGQLAKALARLRLQLPSGRIDALTELLQANPQSQAGLSGGPFTKLRWPLTQSELDRLRPYLTLHNLTGGRRGLIDVGTVIQHETITHESWIDSVVDPFQPPYAQGTILAGEGTLSSQHATPFIGVLTSQPPATGASIMLHGCQVLVNPSSDSAAFARIGAGIMIEAPAPMNLHQLGPVARQALSTTGNLLSIPSTPVKTIGELWNFLGMNPSSSGPEAWSLAAWVSPVSSGFELPPIGLVSSGVVTIEAASTVTDRLGRPMARDSVRSIVQAVPQEYLLERRWLTQGDIYGLIAARWGSHVQSWPVACERLTGVAPDDHDFGSESTDTLANIPRDSGMRARPLPTVSMAFLPSEATGKGFPQYAPYLQWPLEQQAVDWRVSFGAAWPVTPDHIYDSQSLALTGHWRTAPSNLPTLPDPTLAARPDGFYHATNTSLNYSLASSFAQAAPTDPITSALFLPRDGTQELAARQFSCWIKPETDWGTATGLHPILEVRMPSTNLGTAMNQTSGSTDSENYLGLVYDGEHHLLVLALAPPSIPSPGDWGPLVDSEDLTHQAIDHRCLAEAPTAPLSPDPYADHADPGVPTSLGAFTAAFARNRVLHCYATPDRNDQPFFRAGQWYHLQVAIASDRPDGVVLIVDGLVGHDAAHKPDGPSLTELGDHVTLPGMVLRQALPALAVTSASMLQVPSLTVAAPPPLNARSCLPQRGIVRIDDEYIAYDHLSADGTALIDCIRGKRQETNAASTVPAQAFPALQAHAVGSLVVPGGYHVTWAGSAAAGGKLYRGGCTLAQNLAVGDLSWPLHPGAVWARAAGGAPAIKTKTSWVLPASATTIPIDPSSPTWSQFPETGIISFNGVNLAYGAKGPASLQQVAPLDGTIWSIAPSGMLSTQPIALSGLAYKPGDAVMLISLQVQSVDPIALGAYKQDPTGQGGGQFLLSLQDDSAPFQDEWIGYDGIISDHISRGYFISLTGFPLDRRAQCRTALGVQHAVQTTQVLPVQTEAGNVGHWLATGDVVTLLPHYLPNASPAMTSVQMAVRYAASDGFWNGPTATPVDSPNWFFAFAQPIPAAAIDSSLPGSLALSLGAWDICCGNCWSGSDLTNAVNPLFGVQRSPQPRGQLPRLDLWSSQRGAAGIDAHVVIGRGSISTAGPLSDDFTIDDLCAGGLTHSGMGPDGHDSQTLPMNSVANGVRQFWIDGLPTGHLSASDSLANVVVETTTPIFTWGTGPNMGLILIDGEVFAYQRPSWDQANQISTHSADVHQLYPGEPASIDPSLIQQNGLFATLVARGLLNDGTGGDDHRIGSGTFGEGPVLQDQQMHTPLLSALRLPLGPVRQLDGAISSDGGINPWFGLRDWTQGTTPKSPPAIRPLGAPIAMVCTPDGRHVEAMQLIGPKPPLNVAGVTDTDVGKHMTAPWIRGLYNTGTSLASDGSDWIGSDASPRPIVIGWWPRYPSALPSSAPSTASLRSRTFPWISFPFAISGGYFDPKRLGLLPAMYQGVPLIEVDVVPDPLFVIEARALSGSDAWSGPPPAMDWALQRPTLLPTSGTNPMDASGVVDPATDGSLTLSDGHRSQPLDGLEVRINWRYAGAPSNRLEDIAAAGNRSPTIRSVRIRCLAPVRVLQINDAR